MENATCVVGSSILKRDTLAKVRGETQYVADIRRPDLLYAHAVRSPYASARIRGIDPTPALARAGVVAVLTAKDIPGEKLVGARGVRDQPVLAENYVRFAGEAVAVVVAVSPEAAAEAANCVVVDYEILEPLVDPALALSADAPPIQPQGNLCHEARILRGDVHAAFASAALVVKNTFCTRAVDHGSIEPDAVLAERQGDDEHFELVIRASSKSPHNDQEEVHRVLGIPKERVRVIATSIGGSFGGKPDLPSVCMASVIALRLKRPVKMVLDRAETFLANTKRHPYRMEYTHAVAADGTILGAKVDILADGGAYTSYTPTSTGKGLIHALGPYRVPNVDMHIRAAFTNNTVSGAMRGYGVPQVVFAVERQMDMIARRLRMDPFEFRMKNFLQPGDTTVTGQVLTDGRLTAAMRQAKRHVESLPALPADAPTVKRAWGMAAFIYGVGRSGIPDKAKVSARLDADGYPHLFVGTPDTGQGSDTALAQIAAQELGLPFGMIRVTSGDTGVSFDAGTSTASRVTYVVGNAVQRAAAELKALLLDAMSEREGQAIERIPADLNYLRHVADFCDRHHIETTVIGDFSTRTVPLDENGQGEPYGSHSFGVQMSQVRVDIETGKVDVERVICCYDAGTVVNPALLAGQVEGGTAIAQGYALSEEFLANRGVPTTTSFHTYMLPTALDVPPIQVSTVESFDTTGPFGAKGLAEPTTLPGAASIANALANAVGSEFFDLPLTPEKVVSSEDVHCGND